MAKTRALLFGGLGSVVAYLAFVEFTSGIIQGYYTPFMTDIARHLNVNDADVNWLEGAQLMLSALVVPALSKLGDTVGHRRMLLLSTAVTFLASLLIAVSPVFWLFLIAWALQGFYVVWLPLEIALIYIRSREVSADAPAALTRRAAGVLVAALELGAITGALTGGALVDALPLEFVLALPAVVVGVCWIVIAVGVRETDTRPGPAGFDTVGLIIVTASLALLMGSLFVLRGSGIDFASGGFWSAVGMLLLGAAGLYGFARFEMRHPDPVIDVRMFVDASLWPVFATAGLFGMSVLGAQAPLSTFARTDPEVYGFGLGTSGFATSLIIGLYLIAMTVGALLVPVAARLTSPRWALVIACLLVALGYGMFLPMHDHYGQVISNMTVAGLGSGALVASLPAAAAAAAPSTQTGVATGMTNSVKTVGGAVASCIFGLALSSFAASAGTVPEGTAGSYSGYMTVWAVCSVTAVAAAVLLLFVPKHAFGDRIAPVAG
ncbi:MAG TPA: MFS transporter [Candidatus Agrococcus pullicola]|uniref:MFS transporter n=1 Tax=Candidatus Agrococcus pullicola TaxID=2838429 RepID=A0A9D1YSK4_9MICO|nr:MFS transporter [Candidatus Agrococcus pullicola]